MIDQDRSERFQLSDVHDELVAAESNEIVALRTHDAGSPQTAALIFDAAARFRRRARLIVEYMMGVEAEDEARRAAEVQPEAPEPVKEESAPDGLIQSTSREIC